MRSLDFYFDYLSPYAYLASLEMPALCQRHDVELRLHPVLFAGLLGHWGQKGPAEIPPKGRHAWRDCARHATERGIPMRSPLHHPFNPLTALRASLHEVAGDDQPKVIRTIFAHGWGQGGDLGDPAALAKALDAAGLDGAALLARGSEPRAKQILREETETAVGRGVFGIPTMLVGEELFWGLDQFRWLELFLEGRDPIAGIDRTQMFSQGPSAWRTGIPKLEG